jgi:tetrahydromethanopterin S-methyltransferase subunit B
MPWINLTDLWKTVIYGLIAGVGLPALFAVGLYALSRGPRVQTAGADSAGGSHTDSDVIYGGNIIGLIIAVIIALIILSAIGWGIHYIYVAGHPAPKKH